MLKPIFTLDYEIHGNGEGCPNDLMIEPTARMLDHATCPGSHTFACLLVNAVPVQCEMPQLELLRALRLIR